MTSWRDSLVQARGRFAPGVGNGLRWWRRSLLAWLPVRWQWALGWSRSRLLLARDGEQLIVQRDTAGELQPVLQLPWPQSPADLEPVLDARVRGLPRYWVLPAPAVLRRSLRLPAAAAPRLRDVVGFEIDRQTPFEPGQVHYDVREGDTLPDGQLQVELVVIPRPALEQWLQQSGSWAGQLAGVDADDGSGQPLGVNLLPVGQRFVARDPMRRWNLLLGAAAVVLLALAGNQLLLNRERAADQLHEQVNAAARDARAVAAEREHLQRLVDGAAFLEEKRTAQASTLEVWNELTRLLPDGTYLEKLSVEGRTLQLIGLSREASQLVPLLQASPLWTKVNLTGVLQADGGAGGRDRFTLTAELQPLPGAAPAAPAAAPASEVANGNAADTP
ncbi:PilN domain-containing protein [Stenotrophomonas oahuensis]|uniref:PilN domain-containing protein n=1 Tax=Stenotrophomonas oahuensis TaxID=3003271 RepID=A0ABY9YKL1_9GAMM|nr:PilN domain-containing protein [Stenotrophomonas sp. A5586]WNH50843.1 PilN domain-containing protein [Stenotrophomonas sp. A5586]